MFLIEKSQPCGASSPITSKELNCTDCGNLVKCMCEKTENKQIKNLETTKEKEFQFPNDASCHTKHPSPSL